MMVLRMMEIRMAPLTFSFISTPVMTRPMRHSSAPAVSAFHTLKECSATVVESLPWITLAFSRPMRVMNRPIPALMAIRTFLGMAW